MSKLQLSSCFFLFCLSGFSQGGPAAHARPVTSLPTKCSVKGGDIVALTTGASAGLYSCGPTDNLWIYSGAGAQGPAGVAGPGGPPGATGATGPQGAAGANGTNGTNGTNGSISRVQNAGALLPIEPNLNFTAGGCVDDPGNTRTNCTGGAGGSNLISCAVTGTNILTWPAVDGGGNACTQYVLTRTVNITNGGTIPALASPVITIIDTNNGTFSMQQPTNFTNYPLAGYEVGCTIYITAQWDGANYGASGVSLNGNCTNRIRAAAASPATPQVTNTLSLFSLVATPGIRSIDWYGTIRRDVLPNAQATGRNQAAGTCTGQYVQSGTALDGTPDCPTAGGGTSKTVSFLFSTMCKAAAVADNFVFYGGAGVLQPISAGCSGTAPSAPYMQVPANNNGLGANAYQIGITIPSLPAGYVSGTAITLDWNIFASDTTHVTTVNGFVGCATTTLGPLTPFTLQDTIGSTAASPFHQQVFITPPACNAYQPLFINLEFDNSALVTGPSAFSFTSIVASLTGTI